MASRANFKASSCSPACNLVRVNSTSCLMSLTVSIVPTILIIFVSFLNYTSLVGYLIPNQMVSLGYNSLNRKVIMLSVDN